jgi:hypothetical protein
MTGWRVKLARRAAMAWLASAEFGRAGQQLHHQGIQQGIDGERGLVQAVDAAAEVEALAAGADPGHFAVGGAADGGAQRGVGQAGFTDAPQAVDGDQMRSRRPQQLLQQRGVQRFDAHQLVVGGRLQPRLQRGDALLDGLLLSLPQQPGQAVDGLALPAVDGGLGRVQAVGDDVDRLAVQEAHAQQIGLAVVGGAERLDGIEQHPVGGLARVGCACVQLHLRQAQASQGSRPRLAGRSRP